jgi:hypothetical protein
VPPMLNPAGGGAAAVEEVRRTTVCWQQPAAAIRDGGRSGDPSYLENTQNVTHLWNQRILLLSGRFVIQPLEHLNFGTRELTPHACLYPHEHADMFVPYYSLPTTPSACTHSLAHTHMRVTHEQ